MITVSCPQCDARLKVKDEAAGKRLRCPHCKAPVDVSGNLAAEPIAPAAKNSHAEDATLPPVARRDSPDNATFGHDDESAPQLGSLHPSGQRYQVEDEIARGGMGAVLRATDQDIEREVALKYLLNQADERQKSRFIEEAKITGQLEHPNIVPIHDLGLDGDGKMFLSMKMVKGQSLGQILDEQRTVGQAASLSSLSKQEGRLAARPTEYTLGRLLTIFSNVCNALAYAHSRHVIHRDLKPANVMVGDFGEVYVMDWGLAKVLSPLSRVLGGEGLGERGPASHAKETQVRRKQKADTQAQSKSGDKVKSGRACDSGLTQDGAVMGTPAYMPPEQAKGDNDAVDQRSDIYSLGAILYEILTLTPPVGRGGDAVSILMKVAEGRIDPPAKRAPKRWIPAELSAIAMKALALDPDDRYQTVEELQKDIQLFQEGRSVSAKQDTFWEMFTKLVKRNKGVSIATAVALLVLAAVAGYFLKINYDARVEAETNHSNYLQEQEARRQTLKKSAPAFLEAAKLSVEKKEFQRALDQLEVVLEFDPDSAEARLRKGQLLIVQGKYELARDWLEKYLALTPGDAAARELAELCKTAVADDATSAAALGNVFGRQREFVLAEAMFKDREKLLQIYRQRIEAKKPGLGKYLQIDKNGQLSVLLAFGVSKDSLQALKGIPLNHLRWHKFQTADLTPVADMPLLSLDIGYSEIADFTPLKGTPLKELRVGGVAGPVDLRQLEGLQLEKLVVNDFANLPGVRGMPLKWLTLGKYDKSKSFAADIQCLKDLPLQHLTLHHAALIVDLTFLEGMSLETLELQKASKLTNIEPLRGMPLKTLNLSNSPIKDLTPLEGMELERVSLPANAFKGVKGIEVLRDMESLQEIWPFPGPRLSREEFWKKYDAGELTK